MQEPHLGSPACVLTRAHTRWPFSVYGNYAGKTREIIHWQVHCQLLLTAQRRPSSGPRSHSNLVKWSRLWRNAYRPTLCSPRRKQVKTLGALYSRRRVPPLASRPGRCRPTSPGAGARGRGAGPAGAGNGAPQPHAPPRGCARTHFLPEGAPKPALGAGNLVRAGGRKPPTSFPENQNPKRGGGNKNRNGESKGPVLTEPSKAEEPVCRGRRAGPALGAEEARGRAKGVWVKPRNPGPRDPASSTQSTHCPGRGRGKAREGSRDTGPLPRTSRTSLAEGGARPPPAAAQRAPLPEAGLAEREVHGRRRVHKQRSPQPRAPSPSARRYPGSPHPTGDPGAWGERCPAGRGALRRTHPGPAASPPACAHSAASAFPRPAQARGLGIKRGSARRRPPGRAADTHRELGRPPAGRARGCRSRRGWAQGTGLGCSAATAAAAAGHKCGSETGREGRGAETAACAPPGPPPGMCHIRAGARDHGRSPLPPGGWRGGRKLGTARARPQ